MRVTYFPPSHQEPHSGHSFGAASFGDDGESLSFVLHTRDLDANKDFVAKDFASYSPHRSLKDHLKAASYLALLALPAEIQFIQTFPLR